MHYKALVCGYGKWKSPSSALLQNDNHYSLHKAVREPKRTPYFWHQSCWDYCPPPSTTSFRVLSQPCEAINGYYFVPAHYKEPSSFHSHKPKHSTAKTRASAHFLKLHLTYVSVICAKNVIQVFFLKSAPTPEFLQ